MKWKRWMIKKKIRNSIVGCRQRRNSDDDAAAMLQYRSYRILSHFFPRRYDFRLVKILVSVQNDLMMGFQWKWELDELNRQIKNFNFKQYFNELKINWFLFFFVYFRFRINTSFALNFNQATFVPLFFERKTEHFDCEFRFFKYPIHENLNFTYKLYAISNKISN